MALRLYQSDLNRDNRQAWDDGARVVMAVLPTGGGKCLGRDTPVLMYDGAVQMVQDVKLGDLLMGPDSGPRRVLSLATGQEMLYRVSPVKGDPYIVNESHILSLRMTNYRGLAYAGDGNAYSAGQIAAISVRDYRASNSTFKHVAKGWRSGVDFSNLSTLPIAPYVLGIWLGDGTESRGACLTNVDDEVLSAWYEWARDEGCLVRVETQEHTQCSMHHIHGDGWHNNHALNALRNVGVHGKRHIPHAYKTASRADRLELLAGIIDTDGYLAKNNFEVVTKSKLFADDIAFLARSLGLACYFKECRKTCTNTGAIGTYHRGIIQGATDEVPCRVPRRQASPRKQIKNVLCTGIKVEPLEVGEYFGFEIDGDRLFMLGDFTVTHNTVCMGDIARGWNGWGTAIAHRGELVSQISKAFAREGIVHKVICSEATRRGIQAEHYEEFGRSYINQGKADWAVASVDTIIKRPGEEAFKRSTLAIEDEGHHALKSNKWGRVFNMFTPECKGLLYTATPIRADGAGLGAGFDGIADMMIEGPGMGWMIENGYLTDYDVACPSVRDLDLSHLKLTPGGDMSQKELAEIFAKSKQIVGDVVKHYLELAPGKLGITFAVNIDEANKIAAAFCAAGVPALVVHGKSTDDERRGALRKFRNREVLQLVNVDLFGEGFDLPAIEVVSMARPTASYSLYCQQFGRALRLMISPILQAAWDTYSPEQRKTFIVASNKPRAIIIDHVGNLMRHMPPDRPQVWTLGRIKRGSVNSDAIPLRSCEKCFKHFERIHVICPHCGTVQTPPEPSERMSPKTVDGRLDFVSQEVLDEMRRSVRKIDGACYVGAAQKGTPAEASIHRKHAERLRAQHNLRHVIDCWAGMFAADEHSVNQARFYHTFKIDVLSACSLPANEANELRVRITERMALANTLIKGLPFPDDANDWSNAA